MDWVHPVERNAFCRSSVVPKVVLRLDETLLCAVSDLSLRRNITGVEHFQFAPRPAWGQPWLGLGLGWLALRPLLGLA